MTNYIFNGVNNGMSTGNFVAGGPNPDFLYITYPRGFDTLNIRTDNQGNTIVESALGGSFIMKGVTLDQLSDANFGQVDGDVDIGTNGPDWLSGSIVVGKAGNDTIWGMEPGSNDFLAGNQGNDDINGNGGMDRIRGGQGEDDIYGFGTGSIVYGDKGADDINASSANNTDPDDTTGVTIFGGSGDPNDPLDGGDDIIGSSYNDFLQGNGGEDDIQGGGGDDEIRGGKDDDDLFGQNGMDWLRGDKGDDHVDGGRDADILAGGEGKDTFHFHAGGGTSDIAWVTRENISQDALNILPENFGLAQLHMLDRITDLDLGDDGFHGVDKLAFQGWDSGGADAGEVATVTNVSANNMADLLAAYYNEVGVDTDDQAVIIEVNSGAFAGKDFLFVSTSDFLGAPVPSYAMQITGYTGTLDVDDIIST